MMIMRRRLIGLFALTVACIPGAAVPQGGTLDTVCAQSQYVAIETPTGFAIEKLPLLPWVTPPVPEPLAPLTDEAAGDTLVVEGNFGKYIRSATFEQSTAHSRPAVFSWQPGARNPALNIPILNQYGGWSNLRFPIGHTTMYEICVFQKDGPHEAKCADPATWPQQSTGTPPTGAYLFRADCSDTELIPNYGEGLAQYKDHAGNINQNGFIPAYSPAAGLAHYPSRLDLAWKMRACNGSSRCSAWTDAIGLVWVPPPQFRDPIVSIRNSASWRVSFSWYTPLDQGRDGLKATLCISTPAVHCEGDAEGDPEARTVPWIKKARTPDPSQGGVTLPSARDSNGNPFWFAGRRANWTAGACWNPPDSTDENGNLVEKRDVCVYQQNFLIADFPPAP